MRILAKVVQFICPQNFVELLLMALAFLVLLDRMVGGHLLNL